MLQRYRQQVAMDRCIIRLNYKQIMSDTRSTRYEGHVPPPGPTPYGPVSVTSHATNFRVFQPPDGGPAKKILEPENGAQKICIKYDEIEGSAGGGCQVKDVVACPLDLAKYMTPISGLPSVKRKGPRKRMDDVCCAFNLEQQDICFSVRLGSRLALLVTCAGLPTGLQVLTWLAGHREG